jgi:hypothetical protein
LGDLIFWAPCIFWVLIPCRCIAGKHFLPFFRQPFQFRDHLFSCPEALQFHIVPFVNPFF